MDVQVTYKMLQTLELLDDSANFSLKRCNTNTKYITEQLYQFTVQQMLEIYCLQQNEQM